MPPLAEILGLLCINGASLGVGWGIIQLIDSDKYKYLGLNVSIILLSLLLGIKGTAMAFHILKNVCWEGSLFGALIMVVAIILGPHKEISELLPKKGYLILWEVLICLGLIIVLWSLFRNPF
jgi:hypothetical protein